MTKIMSLRGACDVAVSMRYSDTKNETIHLQRLLRLLARNDMFLSFRTMLSSGVMLIRNLVENLCRKIPASAGMTWRIDRLRLSRTKVACRNDKV